MERSRLDLNHSNIYFLFMASSEKKLIKQVPVLYVLMSRRKNKTTRKFFDTSSSWHVEKLFRLKLIAKTKNIRTNLRTIRQATTNHKDMAIRNRVSIPYFETRGARRKRPTESEESDEDYRDKSNSDSSSTTSPEVNRHRNRRRRKQPVVIPKSVCRVQEILLDFEATVRSTIKKIDAEGESTRQFISPSTSDVQTNSKNWTGVGLQKRSRNQKILPTNHGPTPASQ